MPRYYFDVINGHGLERDDEGKELPSSDAVRFHVAEIVTAIARDEFPENTAVSIKVVVRDDTDFAIFSGSLTFEVQWND